MNDPYLENRFINCWYFRMLYWCMLLKYVARWKLIDCKSGMCLIYWINCFGPIIFSFSVVLAVMGLDNVLTLLYKDNYITLSWHYTGSAYHHNFVMNLQAIALASQIVMLDLLWRVSSWVNTRLTQGLHTIALASKTITL